MAFGPRRFFFLLGAKLLRLNLAGEETVASEFQDLTVLQEEQFPPSILPTIRALNQEVEALGNIFCFNYTVEGLSLPIYSSVHVAPDRSACFENICEIDEGQVGSSSLIASFKKNGGAVVTTNQPRTLDSAPQDEVKYLKRANLAKLQSRHQARIKKKDLRNVPTETEAIKALILEGNKQTFSYFLQRGLFVPAPD